MNAAVSKYLIWSPILLSRGQNIWPLLKMFQKRQYCSQEQIAEKQFVDFKRVFEYAYTSVPFYRMKYQAAGISPVDIKIIDDVDKIPLLTKPEIIDHLDTINNTYKGKIFKRSTSGSTGKPFVFYKDIESMTYMDAILYRNYSWYDIDLGDRQARFWGHPLSRTGILKTRAIDALLNRKRLSAFDLHETSYRLYLRQIEQFNAQYVYGYAQSIFQFSNYFHVRNIDLSYLEIKAVIVTGEMIFSHQIEVIKRIFGCPVTQEYGCTEVGLIGFGCPEGTIHVMENLLVESHLPQPADGIGEIVVSELYGKQFPFIRYLLGDRGRISTRNCSCGRGLKVLDKLSGRKDDFITCPDGRLIDPYLVEYAIGEMPGTYGRVHQFKVIQKDFNSLQIMLNAVGDSELIVSYISDKLKKLLPASMQVQIDIVSELPKELSGKLRCFVSLLKSQ